MDKKLRFGIVGAAGVVGQAHVEAARTCPHGCLVGVTDVNVVRGKSIAERTGASWFDSFDDMVRSDMIDTIGVATPHALHHDMSIAALRADKHVLLEKPIAVTIGEADRIADVAEQTGRRLGVVFQKRFRKVAQKAREIIVSGVLGPIYRTQLTFSSYKTDGYYRSGAWRGTWAGEGGGVLYNQGCHPIDLFLWLGGMPRRVHGWTPTLTHAIDVEDMATALLEYPTGAQGSIHCNTVQAPAQNLIEFYGENGRLAIDGDTLVLDRLEMPLLKFQALDHESIYAAPRSERQTMTFAQDTANHATVYAAFAERVLGGQDPPVPAREAAKSLELVNAITLSHFRGTDVLLPIDRAEYQTLFDELKRMPSRKR